MTGLVESVASISCAYNVNDNNPESFVGKLYGSVFGGIAGLVILISASTIIIIVTVCVRKRKRRQQPLIGVLEIGPGDNHGGGGGGGLKIIFPWLIKKMKFLKRVIL